MAEIPVERKGGIPWWVWALLAAILIALAIWWIAADDDVETAEPVAVEAVEPLAPGPVAPVAGEADMTIASILASPGQFVGRDDFQAEVAVPEVPTDRGFWVEDQGQRLFAVIVDEPREVPLDINSGQRLRVTQGMVRDATFLPQLPGASIDDATRRIIESQNVFLVVDEENIEILSRP